MKLVDAVGAALKQQPNLTEEARWREPADFRLVWLENGPAPLFSEVLEELGYILVALKALLGGLGSEKPGDADLRQALQDRSAGRVPRSRCRSGGFGGTALQTRNGAVL